MGTDGGSSPHQPSTSSSSYPPPCPSDGIIPRAVHELFHTKSTLADPSRVTISMSYLEIYNEEVRDLLSSTSAELVIRDSRDGTVVVQNLSKKDVNTPTEVTDCMKAAGEKRATASTAMNAVSSRSHAICTLVVTIAPDKEGNDEAMSSKLTLVDLAGSERIKRTGAEGTRMKEGININKGLFVLGQVVSSLSEIGQSGGAGSNAHIPYRDSKLTRLLQDSLGGNSRTVMVACVSPADSNVEESLNTLRYASRTRNIKNAAVKNVVATAMSPAEAAALRRENQLLKLKVMQLEMKVNEGGGGSGSGCSGGMVDVNEDNASGVNVAQLEIITRLRATNTSLATKVSHLEDQLQSAAENYEQSVQLMTKERLCMDSISSRSEETINSLQNNVETLFAEITHLEDQLKFTTDNSNQLVQLMNKEWQCMDSICSQYKNLIKSLRDKVDELSTEKLHTLKVSQLKVILRQHDLPVSGRKAELLKRLQTMTTMGESPPTEDICINHQPRKKDDIRNYLCKIKEVMQQPTRNSKRHKEAIQQYSSPIINRNNKDKKKNNGTTHENDQNITDSSCSSLKTLCNVMTDVNVKVVPNESNNIHNQMVLQATPPSNCIIHSRTADSPHYTHHSQPQALDLSQAWRKDVSDTSDSDDDDTKATMTSCLGKPLLSSRGEMKDGDESHRLNPKHCNRRANNNVSDDDRIKNGENSSKENITPMTSPRICHKRKRTTKTTTHRLPLGSITIN